MSAVILAARRTIVAPRNGVLARFGIADLAVPVLLACLEDAGVKPAEVDEVILGNALGAGGNPARVAALQAGFDPRVAGISIDRQCCSGLDAILLAQAMIAAGQAEIVLAGGAESYSRRPLRFHSDPDGGDPVPYDRPPFTPWPDRDPEMAEAADGLSHLLGITREDQDEWAIASHQKALAARDQLEQECVSLAELPGGADPFARRLTPAHCRRAPVVFGQVTVATTAPAADGAAFCLVVSEKIARRLGRAGVRIVAGQTLGGDPELPGLAPVAAMRAVLKQAGVFPNDIAQAEIMEAFAVQALACVREVGLDPAIVNPGGGALARGHPIGASGAVLATRLFHDLPRGLGLAAIAAAGGLGTALLVER